MPWTYLYSTQTYTPHKPIVHTDIYSTWTYLYSTDINSTQTNSPHKLTVNRHIDLYSTCHGPIYTPHRLILHTNLYYSPQTYTPHRHKLNTNLIHTNWQSIQTYTPHGPIYTPHKPIVHTDILHRDLFMLHTDLCLNSSHRPIVCTD